MSHSSINVSLTYLRGLEIPELTKDDIHVVYKKTPLKLFSDVRFLKSILFSLHFPGIEVALIRLYI